MDLIISLLVCALIGWLAGIIMKSSYAWWVNILLGIVGGWLGSFIPFVSEIGGSTIGGILSGVLGAVIVIFIARLIKK
ncbi:MAG: GlsB/YeaQ/YmgE family stress response membrane protein [Bacteroidales bacterium]|nr:GlsB/YeaQ/YmgE family stress response membrane protein [Bacteroidales bacterium]